jgi:antitoxin Phd
MTTMSVRQARERLRDVGDMVEFRGERVVVTRNRRPAFAFVSVEDLKLLEAMEDRVDLEEARKAIAEGGARPFEDVAKELGL